ncbi:threonine dehydratase biosynthetic, chloroplastic [Tanacetum coccineum]
MASKTEENHVSFEKLGTGRLPDRTDNEIKNYSNSYLSKKRKQWKSKQIIKKMKEEDVIDKLPEAIEVYKAQAYAKRKELVRQMQGPLHAIFVLVGSGGLITSIVAYVKRVSSEVWIIGVESADANAIALSLHHGKRVILDQVGGFADGVAIKEVGSECFCLCRELIDRVILISHDAICASIKAIVWVMAEEISNEVEQHDYFKLIGLLDCFTSQVFRFFKLIDLLPTKLDPSAQISMESGQYDIDRRRDLMNAPYKEDLANIPLP